MADIFGDMLREHMEDSIVYGKVISENAGDDGEAYSIKISLINDTMLKADLFFLNEHYEDIDYRIEGYLSELSEEETDAFRQYRPYFYEFESNDILPYQKVMLSQFGESWMRFEFSEFDERIYGDNYFSFAGTIRFSASPLIAMGKRLIFNRNSLFDDTTDLLNSIYSKSSVARYTYAGKNANNWQFFDDLIPTNTHTIDTDIYSVGLANNIRMHLIGDYGEESTILYDIGVTHIKDVLNRTIVKNNIKNMKKINPDAIVLSHWDVDHILGVGYYNPKRIYDENVVWVAPDINLLSLKEMSLSAVRLACYVANKCILCLADREGYQINANSIFQVWQGEYIDKAACSHGNAIGLLIKIAGSGTYQITTSTGGFFFANNLRDLNVLLTGDCVYENMPFLYKKRSSSLIVSPHHGTDLTKPCINASQDATAIISSDKSGTNTTYPGKKHVVGLVNMGYNHIYTTEKNGNIYIHISIW